MFMSETHVKQQLDESLSALVDGEISELELRRLLKASNEEYAALRENWSAYHMASAAVNKEIPAVQLHDLSASISAAIDAEPTHTSSSKPVQKKSIWSGVGRFAVAASVAGAVVLGVQFAPNDLNNQVADVDSLPVQPAQVPSSFGHGIPVDTTVNTVSNENSTVKTAPKKDTIILNESTQKQLQQAEEQVGRFMLEHAQNASQNTQQGVLPYKRVPESSEQ
jgi:sigma-E factor negative regulatory protein RseA